MESAVEKLREFYQAEEANIHVKVRPYYHQVFTGVSLFTTQISLRLCSFSELDFDHLSRVLPFYPHCTEFTLWKANLTSTAVTHLSSSLGLLMNLEVLAMQDNHLRDESLLCASRTINHLINMTEIWLSSNEITAAGAVILASSIAGFPQLAIINLDFNYVGDEGCAALCKALVARNRIKMLGLRGNKLTNGAVPSLQDLGENNPPLLNLDLQSNSFTPSACRSLKSLYGDVATLDKQDVAR